MTLIAYPESTPPRCNRCLLFVADRAYIPADQCGEGCLTGYDMRSMGERPNWGHLHWRCECGFVWATMTALQSGRDSERQ